MNRVGFGALSVCERAKTHEDRGQLESTAPEKTAQSV